VSVGIINIPADAINQARWGDWQQGLRADRHGLQVASAPGDHKRFIYRYARRDARVALSTVLPDTSRHVVVKSARFPGEHVLKDRQRPQHASGFHQPSSSGVTQQRRSRFFTLPAALAPGNRPAPGYNDGMDEPEPTRRRWLTHERTVLLVVAIAIVLLLGWLGPEVYTVRHRKAVRKQIEASGGSVFTETVDWGTPTDSVVVRPIDFGALGMSKTRALLGDERVTAIWIHHQLTDADRESIKVFPEAEVRGPANP
jgi:hypothetical protein